MILSAPSSSTVAREGVAVQAGGDVAAGCTGAPPALRGSFTAQLAVSLARPGAAEARTRLQGLLSKYGPREHPAPESGPGFGVPEIDAVLGGGLPRGCLAELIAPGLSCGAQIALVGLLARAAAARWKTALIDPSDALDPCGCPRELLEQLLWVRPSGLVQSLKCADLLARDGNLPLLVLDLRGVAHPELRREPAASWFRLRAAATASGCILVLLTPLPVASAAAPRVRLLAGAPALSAQPGLRLVDIPLPRPSLQAPTSLSALPIAA